MFLVPTCAVMWFVGRGATAYATLSWINLCQLGFVDALAAFVHT
jgi:hypothetical protein